MKAKSFLSVFYGANIKPNEPHRYPNTMAYNNKEYNSYYEQGRNASSRDSAAKYFIKADQVLMNDAVIIPLITKLSNAMWFSTFLFIG